MEVAWPPATVVVSSPLLEVEGRASPDATVSVEGELANRSRGGGFSLTWELKEGPNLLEVIATDLAGGQQEALLMVIYIP